MTLKYHILYHYYGITSQKFRLLVLKHHLREKYQGWTAPTDTEIVDEHRNSIATH